MSNTAKAKLIRQLQTPAGGWTKESLAQLGIGWPPPRGWKKRLEAKIWAGSELVAKASQ